MYHINKAIRFLFNKVLFSHKFTNCQPVDSAARLRMAQSRDILFTIEFTLTGPH